MRLLIIIVALCAFVTSAAAQTPSAKPAAPAASPSDVITVNTELVQTDVTVFDKSGRLVEGLSRDEFELTLDGKPRPISFFESVRTGSSREAAQLKPEQNRNGNVDARYVASCEH